MKPLSKFINKLCGNLLVLLAYLLVELIILIQKQRSRPINTRQYLKLIEKKNPTICYSKRLKADDQEEESECCRVCLSEFEEGEKLRKLKCQHTFHRDCLDKWLQQYWATCPLCRKQVLPNDVVLKHRQHQNQALAALNGNDNHLPYFLSAFRAGNTMRYL